LHDDPSRNVDLCVCLQLFIPARSRTAMAA
jgi:hypothetical protein